MNLIHYQNGGDYQLVFDFEQLFRKKNLLTLSKLIAVLHLVQILFEILKFLFEDALEAWTQNVFFFFFKHVPTLEIDPHGHATSLVA